MIKLKVMQANENLIKASWRTLLEHDYDQSWHDHIWPEDQGVRSLKNYRLYRSKIEIADYLNGTYEHHKKFLARLRMGGHRLPIEIGRH